MKVLHIIPNLAKGGAERLVIDIIEALNKQEGVEARLFIFEDIIAYDVSQIREFIKIIPVSVSLSIYKKNKINVEMLQSAILEFSPNIIHSHLFYAELVSRSCIFPQAKWFSHCHDNMPQVQKLSLNTIFKKVTITNFYERWFLKKAYAKNGGNTFIAISNDTLHYFKMNLSKYSIHLLHNAINFNKFYFEKSKLQSTNNIKLINVGSFVDKKNQQFLIQVAKLLSDKQINFELHFLGDGPNLPKVKQMTLDLGLTEKVFFHGNVEKVQDYLKTAAIYVHSAYYEPLGLVLIEAMAAGLPVVCLDGKGNRDLMLEGKNGFLIPAENPQIFCNKILEVWGNPNSYNNMSKFSQQYAKNFDIENYVTKLIALYTKN